MATSAILPYGARFAWISMVLVAGAYRRRGLATLLMRRAMDDLPLRGSFPFSTPRPTAAPFIVRLALRIAGDFTACAGSSKAMPPAADRASLPAGIDRAPDHGTRLARAVRVRYRGLWRATRRRACRAARALAGGRARCRSSATAFVGFCLGRDGRIAAHIGPLVAENDAIACALLARALDAIAGPAFIDLADAKSPVREFLEQRGFAPVRPFTRMLYGRAERFDDAARTFAVVGPEFG